MARKLAVIIWHMIIKKEPYKIELVQVNSEKQKALKIKQLEKKLYAMELNKEELDKLFLRSSMAVM
jgi:uncharacterized membrane protein